MISRRRFPARWMTLACSVTFLRRVDSFTTTPRCQCSKQSWSQSGRAAQPTRRLTARCNTSFTASLPGYKSAALGFNRTGNSSINFSGRTARRTTRGFDCPCHGTYTCRHSRSLPCPAERRLRVHPFNPSKSTGLRQDSIRVISGKDFTEPVAGFSVSAHGELGASAFPE